MAGSGRQVTAIISQSGEPLRALSNPWLVWPHWSSVGSCDTPHTPDSLLTDSPDTPILSQGMSFSMAQILNRGVEDGCILSPELVINHSTKYETRPFGKYLDTSLFSRDYMEDFQTSPIFGKIAEENTDDSSICSVSSNSRHYEASKENIDFSNTTYNQEKKNFFITQNN